MTAIFRLRTNPEGKDRAASCRPPSVLVPGSALGSCRHSALSSAQAVLHRSAGTRRGQRPSARSTRGPPGLAGPLPTPTGRLQLAIPLGEDRRLPTGQLRGGRDVADRTVEPHVVVMPHAPLAPPPRGVQRHLRGPPGAP